MSTFVSVGNATQGFPRLLADVVECASALPKPIIIQYGHTLFDYAGSENHAFLRMEEFVRNVSESEVVIVHAGAGSVIHAIRAGKVPIVMPRRYHLGEHIDDHQFEFASALAATSKAIMVENAMTMRTAVSQVDKLRHRDVGSTEPRVVSQIRALLLERVSRT